MSSDSDTGRLPPHILNPLLAKAPENIAHGVARFLQDGVSALLNQIPETAVPGEKIHPFVITLGQYQQKQLPLAVMAEECRKVQQQLKAAYQRVSAKVEPANASPAVNRDVVYELLGATNDIMTSAVLLAQNEPAKPAVDREPDMKLGDTKLWFR